MNFIVKVYNRLMPYCLSLLRSPMILINVIVSRSIQNHNFDEKKYSDKNLIVFFIPGIQGVTGGVLQIFTLNRLTNAYFKDKNVSSIICWLPGEGKEYRRFEGFKNNEIIYQIEMVLARCGDNSKLLFHIPEFAAKGFYHYFGDDRFNQLKKKHDLEVNILNQNIDVMLEPAFIDKYKNIFPAITSTAGNPGWASDEERERLNIPIYPLPTWYYPDDAPWQSYQSKKNLLIVSPDKHDYRNKIISKIRDSLPSLEIKIIRSMKYEEYLDYERNAKWSLTFGEGLDGYFYGPAFRGGVSFAVRNNTFNHKGLTDLKTVYDDYELMAEKIVNDICTLDNKESYEEYNSLIRIPLTKLFGRKITSDALSVYYSSINF